jgi:hypothetical protein
MKKIMLTSPRSGFVYLRSHFRRYSDNKSTQRLSLIGFFRSSYSSLSSPSFIWSTTTRFRTNRISYLQWKSFVRCSSSTASPPRESQDGTFEELTTTEEADSSKYGEDSKRRRILADDDSHFSKQSDDGEETGPRKGNNNDDLSWTKKILYSSYFQHFQPHLSFRERKLSNVVSRIEKANERFQKNWTTEPITSRLLREGSVMEAANGNEGLSSSVVRKGEEMKVIKKSIMKNEDDDLPPPTDEAHQHHHHYPYRTVTKLEFTTDGSNAEDVRRNEGNPHQTKVDPLLGSKYESEADKLEKHGLNVEELLTKSVEDDGDGSKELFYQEFGSPDSRVRPSNVPCGGCGAYLHCQDPSVPGFVWIRIF